MSLALLENTSEYLYEPANQTGSPERLLLLAILERAILDYVGNDSKEAVAAREWIFGSNEPVLRPVPVGTEVIEIDAAQKNNDEFENDEDTEPFSFVWVCRELDLNPKGVAEMIRLMPKRGSHRIAPWYFSRREEWKQN